MHLEPGNLVVGSTGTKGSLAYRQIELASSLATAPSRMVQLKSPMMTKSLLGVAEAKLLVIVEIKLSLALGLQA